MPKVGSNGSPKLVNRGGAGLRDRGGISDAGITLPTMPKGSIDNIRCEGEVVLLSSLILDPNNARLHGDRNLEAIKGSLILYGQRSPLVVRQQNRHVAAGNGRLRCMKELGWTKCAVSFSPMTDAEFTGYGLADNRTAELAAWDFEVVQRLEKLQTEAGQPLVGWSPEEVVALRLHGQKFHADPDTVPEPPKVAVTKPGDMWLLGNHRLLCGDSSSKEDVEKLMGKSKAVLIVTDPPYGVDFKGQKYNPRAKAWDGIKGDSVQGVNLTLWLADLLQLWTSYVDKDFVLYAWTAAMQEGFAALEAIKSVGLHVQSQIIWAKNVLVLGQADYQWKHENAWYAFFKGKQHRWFGGRNKVTVWDVSKIANSAYLHPMQKPVDLYKIPMENHTKPGELCAEPFSGSGTQIIAAEEMKRVCYAMELDPVYVDVAVKRWEAFTGKVAVLAD